MTKQEFLTELQRALTNKLSAAAVAGHVGYYREYIEVEVRKGKREEEVVEELGSPRLIAKSILTAAATEQEQSDYVPGQNMTEEDGMSRSGVLGNLPGWLWILVLVVIVLIAGAFFVSVIRIFLPVLLPLALVIFLVKWWNSHR